MTHLQQILEMAEKVRTLPVLDNLVENHLQSQGKTVKRWSREWDDAEKYVIADLQEKGTLYRKTVPQDMLLLKYNCGRCQEQVAPMLYAIVNPAKDKEFHIFSLDLHALTAHDGEVCNYEFGGNERTSKAIDYQELSQVLF